jgi:hypothetical protein
MNTSSVAPGGLNQARAGIAGGANRVSAGPEDTLDFSPGAVTVIQAKYDFAANIRSLTAAGDLNDLVLRWHRHAGAGCCQAQAMIQSSCTTTLRRS